MNKRSREVKAWNDLVNEFSNHLLDVIKIMQTWGTLSQPSGTFSHFELAETGDEVKAIFDKVTNNGRGYYTLAKDYVFIPLEYMDMELTDIIKAVKGD